MGIFEDEVQKAASVKLRATDIDRQMKLSPASPREPETSRPSQDKHTVTAIPVRRAPHGKGTDP